MTGNIYRTPEGKIHKVIDFDGINKMAYINVIGGNYRWVHEPEYSTWVLNDTAQMPKIYIPDIPAQMIDEPEISQPKTEDDAIQIPTADALDVFEQTSDGEGMGEGNPEPEKPTEESQVESKEKVKKTRKKKATE